MPRSQASPRVDSNEQDKPRVQRTLPANLETTVNLTMGQIFYHDVNGKLQHCDFQFNPTEIERSRNINYTRSRTGNILEERKLGGRNSTKRKQTRKPDPWDMSLTLRFDAEYGKDKNAQPSPVPDIVKKITRPGDTPDPNPYNPQTAKYKDEIKRIKDTIHFFEQIVEAEPFVEAETEKVANADETPPPPYIFLALGPRAWQCAVKSVRIKEDDYTIDLYPRRFEVTLSLEVIETTQQNEQKKGPEVTAP